MFWLLWSMNAPGYLFIMDGKPSIKIMSKFDMLRTLRQGHSETDIRIRTAANPARPKRSSNPAISTGILAQRKTNLHYSTVRRLQPNNFVATTPHMQIFSSSKKLIEYKTSTVARPAKDRVVSDRPEAQKLLLKCSDKVFKLYWAEMEELNPPLVLSADFVVDQDAFWGPTGINNSAVKNWRALHRGHFVIWVIRQQTTLRKLKQFAEKYQLPMHGVYYHCRQSHYTVDYLPLRKNLHKIYGLSLTEIKFIDLIKVNTKDFCDYASFWGKIPVMFDARLRVCFIRQEQSGQGLEPVVEAVKALSENLIKTEKLRKLNSIESFIDDYLTKARDETKIEGNHSINIKTQTNPKQIQNIDEEAERQVQQLKRQLIEGVIREKGRAYQHEGFSIHYFVGDIVKRNYNLLLHKAYQRLEKKSRFTSMAKKSQPLSLGLKLDVMEHFYQYYI